MVCAKCQKLATTKLATPSVKRRSEIYHGSPASGSGAGASGSATTKSSATLGITGISKSKLLGKQKNPYATSATSTKCRDCSTQTQEGKKLCHRCAFKQNACAMCGKSENKTSKGGVPVIQAQKFSAK